MGRKTIVKTLLSSTQLSSGETATTSIEVSRFTEATIFVEVTAKSGTSPTLDADAQVSHDNDVWHKHTALTQINDPTITYYADVVKLTNISRYLRLNITIGGSSTPTMTAKIIMILKD
tara:strand:+ start:241 stop:594 length:354 start_codon:yes stop_codon:yes gene_type:complete